MAIVSYKQDKESSCSIKGKYSASWIYFSYSVSLAMNFIFQQQNYHFSQQILWCSQQILWCSHIFHFLSCINIFLLLFALGTNYEINFACIWTCVHHSDQISGSIVLSTSNKMAHRIFCLQDIRLHAFLT
jgi:hypothetical protein